MTTGESEEPISWYEIYSDALENILPYDYIVNKARSRDFILSGKSCIFGIKKRKYDLVKVTLDIYADYIYVYLKEQKGGELISLKYHIPEDRWINFDHGEKISKNLGELLQDITYAINQASEVDMSKYIRETVEDCHNNESRLYIDAVMSELEPLFPEYERERNDSPISSKVEYNFKSFVFDDCTVNSITVDCNSLFNRIMVKVDIDDDITDRMSLIYEVGTVWRCNGEEFDIDSTSVEFHSLLDAIAVIVFRGKDTDDVYGITESISVDYSLTTDDDDTYSGKTNNEVCLEAFADLLFSFGEYSEVKEVREIRPGEALIVLSKILSGHIAGYKFTFNTLKLNLKKSLKTGQFDYRPEVVFKRTGPTDRTSTLTYTPGRDQLEYLRKPNDTKYPGLLHDCEGDEMLDFICKVILLINPSSMVTVKSLTRPMGRIGESAPVYHVKNFITEMRHIAPVTSSTVRKELTDTDCTWLLARPVTGMIGESEEVVVDRVNMKTGMVTDKDEKTECTVSLDSSETPGTYVIRYDSKDDIWTYEKCPYANDGSNENIELYKNCIGGAFIFLLKNIACLATQVTKCVSDFLAKPVDDKKESSISDKQINKIHNIMTAYEDDAHKRKCTYDYIVNRCSEFGLEKFICDESVSGYILDLAMLKLNIKELGEVDFNRMFVDNTKVGVLLILKGTVILTDEPCSIIYNMKTDTAVFDINDVSTGIELMMADEISADMFIKFVKGFNYATQRFSSVEQVCSNIIKEELEYGLVTLDYDYRQDIIDEWDRTEYISNLTFRLDEIISDYDFRDYVNGDESTYVQIGFKENNKGVCYLETVECIAYDQFLSRYNELNIDYVDHDNSYRIKYYYNINRFKNLNWKNTVSDKYIADKIADILNAANSDANVSMDDLLCTASAVNEDAMDYAMVSDAGEDDSFNEYVESVIERVKGICDWAEINSTTNKDKYTFWLPNSLTFKVKTKYETEEVTLYELVLCIRTDVDNPYISTYFDAGQLTYYCNHNVPDRWYFGKIGSATKFRIMDKKACEFLAEVSAAINPSTIYTPKMLYKPIYV